MTLPGETFASEPGGALAGVCVFAGACVKDETGGAGSVEPAMVMSDPGKGVAHFTQTAALALFSVPHCVQCMAKATLARLALTTLVP